MRITIETKKVKNLSNQERKLMNRGRVSNWGEKSQKNWKKEYLSSSDILFVKNNEKIVAFAVLIPIKINYLRQNYNIIGICSTIALKKGKGYGRVLVTGIISYLKGKQKSGIGFTNETSFFKKAGLGIKKNFIKRFRYLNPKTGKIELDDDGDGIYYNGKDNFIKKILSTKSPCYINIDFW